MAESCADGNETLVKGEEFLLLSDYLGQMRTIVTQVKLAVSVTRFKPWTYRLPPRRSTSRRIYCAVADTFLRYTLRLEMRNFLNRSLTFLQWGGGRGYCVPV